MPPTVHLYVVPPDVESLRALQHFRALVEGPWRGRCDWRVLDPLAAPDRVPAGLPRLPALARGDGGAVTWLSGSPGAGVPADWLERPAVPIEAAAAPAPAAPLPVTLQLCRQLLDASPSGCALFLEPDCLAYANAAFLQRYQLDAGEALGRRVSEWPTTAATGDVAGALAGGGNAGAALTVSRLRVPDPAGELRINLVTVNIPSVEGIRELLDGIRDINHSIGNSLVGILGYAELLQRDLPPRDSPPQTRARAIAAAAQRVDTLSQQISTAVRQFLKRLPER